MNVGNTNKKHQFVDTNIFLYAYDRSEPQKQTKAKALIFELWQSRLGTVSIQVLQELYVNLTRKVPQPLEHQLAAQVISDLGRWNCHCPNQDSLQKALALKQRYQLSFWDAMIITSAQDMHCSVLWSEDLNSGQNYDGVRVKNPFISGD